MIYQYITLEYHKQVCEYTMTQLYYDSLITIAILHDILHSCHNEELLQVSHLTVDNFTHLFHKSYVIVRKSMKREIFKYACGLYSLCCYRLRTTTLYYTLFHMQSSQIHMYTSAYSGTQWNFRTSVQYTTIEAALRHRFGRSNLQ